MAAPLLRNVFRDKFELLPKFGINFCSGRSSLVYTDRKLCTTSRNRAVQSENDPQSEAKSFKISKAMKAYLERAEKNDLFMKDQTADYEIGKRHLANIMGVDPNNFTQADIDEAIKYLLPSGLFEKKARPMLKHPDDIFPKRKAAQFGIDGRPFHPFFYTGLPNYYQIMHDASMKLDELKVYEDEMYNKGTPSDQDQTRKVLTANSEWISLDDLKNMTLERLDEHDYKRFVVLMERIFTHPFCVREKEYLMQFRKPLTVIGLTDVIQPPKEAENGRLYADCEGKRKRAIANVRLWDKGSGLVTINGYGFVDYFPGIMQREQVAFPLQFTNHLMHFDIEVKVVGGGPSGQAGAIRLGVAKALMSFVDKEMVEKMRLAGLLTKDPRTRERKKPGRLGARKRPTWKKR